MARREVGLSLCYNTPMKYILIPLFLLIALPTHAHIIKKDGNFEGMLHILPDDIPLAGTTTEFYFMFEDNKKIVTDCKCEVKILQKGNELYRKNIKDSFFFEFPKIGVYQAEIYRNDFSMTWDIRVEKAVVKPSWFSVFAKRVRELLGI